MPTLTPNVPQQLLPGQAAAPDGPIDMIGMYVLHHAFRRDLDRFLRAVPATPAADRDAWRRLADRWEWFAFVLHHHHTAEDDGLWPPLVERVQRAGDTAGLAVLDAMEAEHAEIDPLLAACRAGFQRLTVAPDADAKAALEVRLVATRRILDAHLGHEERDAIPLVQRHIDPGLWSRLEQEHFSAGYTFGQTVRVLGWIMDELPPAGREAMLAQPSAGAFRWPYRLLVAPVHRRREQRIFGAALR
jgi:hemerythrin-like domain-containing protein